MSETLLNIGAVENAPKAPTKAEVAANPGKYDGTSFDPVTQVVSSWGVVPVFSTLADPWSISVSDFASWFRQDPAGAMLWMQSLQGGNRLILANCTTNQLRKLGLLA